jgi:hypothetical protein
VRDGSGRHGSERPNRGQRRRRQHVVASAVLSPDQWEVGERSEVGCGETSHPKCVAYLTRS